MKKTFFKRKGRRNRHHILAKKRGGTRNPKNMISLDENRHSAFHLLFKNKTFLEAARVLIKAYNMKSGTNYRVVR